MADNFDVDVTLRLKEAGAAAASAAVSRALKDVETQAGAAGKSIDQQLAAAVKRLDAKPAMQLADAMKRIETQQARKEVDALARSILGIEDAGKKAGAGVDQALKQTATGFSNLKSIAGAFGVTLSAQFAVGAVIGFGKEILALGSKMTDLAARMGVGVEAAQEIKFALTQTGSSAEAGARAIGTMNDKLTEGKKGTVAALKSLNLEIGALRQMKPEDAFTAIAEAIRKVPDAMQQTNISREIFGKVGDELLPAIKQGIVGLRDEAHRLGQVISEEDIKALDDFGDKIDSLKTQIEVQLVNVFMDLGRGVRSVADDLKNMVPDGLLDFFKDPDVKRFLDRAAGAVGKGVRNAAVDLIAGANTSFFLQRGQDVHASERQQKEFDGLNAQADQALAFGLQPGRQLNGDQAAMGNEAIRKALAALTPVMKANIDEGQRLSRSVKEIAEEYGIAADVVRAYEKVTATAAKRNPLAELAKDLSGAKLADDLTKIEKAWGLLTPTQQTNGDSIKRLLAAYEPLRKELHVLPPDLEALREQFGKPLPARNLFTSMVTGKQQLIDIDDQAKVSSVNVTNLLKGLRSDGLLPVTNAFVGYADAVDAANIKGQSLETHLVKGQQLTSDWASSLSGLSHAFAELAQIGGDSFGGIAKQIGEVIGLMQLGSAVGQQFRDSFYNAHKEKVLDASGNQARDASGNLVFKGGYDFSAFSGDQGRGAQIGAYANAATTAVAGYGALMQATDVAGRGNRAARGALTGASIGNSIVPGYGALVGAGVGALVGALRNPAWEDVQKRLGHEMGVKITEEFARTIADQAKALFKGDRATAEMFNFAGILDAAGGANDANIDKFSKKFEDVFAYVARSQLSAEQAAKVIDQSWDTMAQAAMKKGGLITKQLQEMISLNDQWGTHSAAIASFVTGQVGSGLGHLESFLGVGNAARTAAGDTTNRDKISALDTEAAAIQGKDGGPGIEDQARLAAIAKQRADLAKADKGRLDAEKVAGLTSIDSQTSATGVSAAISGSFAMLQQQGMSLPDALRAVEPSVKALEEQLKSAGLEGGAAFDDLKKKIALANDTVAGPGIAAMQALGSSIGDLYNGGVLTSDMFKGMAAQIAETRDKLIAQGVDGTAAMELIKPQLQQIYEINQRMPGVLDEATQEMLKQAEAAGIVGDKFKPAIDRVADGIDKMVSMFQKAFGQDLPNAAGTAADRVRDKLSTIPKDFPVKVKVEYEDDGGASHQRNGSASGDQGRAAGDTGEDTPGAADGVYGDGRGGGGLTWFGEGGQPELGGPVDFMAETMARAMRRVGGGFGGQIVITPAPIYIGGKKMGQVSFEQTPLEARRRGVLR